MCLSNPSGVLPTGITASSLSFAVNSGDMMKRWTNHRFKSTPHRALPPVGRERYAIPYFMGPHLDTVVACLPTCEGPDNPPRHPPITYAEYLDWWYDANRFDRYTIDELIEQFPLALFEMTSDAAAPV